MLQVILEKFSNPWWYSFITTVLKGYYEKKNSVNKRQNQNIDCQIFNSFLFRIRKTDLRLVPANTPHLFHVETTRKRFLLRRFNVEHTWCVCRMSVLIFQRWTVNSKCFYFVFTWNLHYRIHSFPEEIGFGMSLNGYWNSCGLSLETDLNLFRALQFFFSHYWYSVNMSKLWYNRCLSKFLSCSYFLKNLSFDVLVELFFWKKCTIFPSWTEQMKKEQMNWGLFVKQLFSAKVIINIVARDKP